MSPVCLWNDELVNSFYRFIFADKASRAPYLYGLELPDPFLYDVRGPLFSTVNDRLAAILREAVHLEYLCFPSSVEVDPVLTSAANATTLRELHVAFVSHMEPSWKLLSSFQSPLLSLYVEEDDGAYDQCFASVLTNDLANFAPTLEILDLYKLVLDMSPDSVTTQFAAVRTLKIRTISDFDGLGLLLRLFPNLDNTLTLSEVMNTTDRSHSTLRERSKEAQRTHSWPRLDRVVCDAQSAFLLAVQCPIRRMDITVPRFHGKRYLASTLRDNYPRFLYIRISFNDSLADLDDLFPCTEGAETLTHLVMVADFEIRYMQKGKKGKKGKRQTVSWKQFRDKLVDSMKHLHLTHLRLVLYYTVIKPTQDSVAKRDSVNTAGDADLYPVALRFSDAMPSLQYIFVTTCGHMHDILPGNPQQASPPRTLLNKWHTSKAWRAVREPLPEDRQNGSNADSTSRAPCMELSWVAAERVIAQEELELSPNEEKLD
ncbi:hypothetical protein GSI_05822 [Ganoderma sinense ZZ0214-1]|uniref:Uncharacterized protein n=1 Tax=Ganoderma sinense ZZ0214-1 TaxID=1077348 RepID=A0A2G8SBI1_9APHY|nr:hypothetical protein GSI_05822 [Ganoderma sinense ZZ0214-1]